MAALPAPAERIFEGTWVVDATTGVVRIVVALAVAVLVWLVGPSLAGHPRETEAYVLMLLGAVGTVALAASGDEPAKPKVCGFAANSALGNLVVVVVVVA